MPTKTDKTTLGRSSLPVIDLKNAKSGSSARIAVDHGFNCFQFLAHLPDGRCVDVLSASDGFPDSSLPATHYGNPLLFPFPNRIQGGRFSWDGAEYVMSPDQVLFDSTGNAIHGFCLDRPWRVVEQTDDSVTGAFQLSIDCPERRPLWPTDAEIRVTYHLEGSCLHSVIRVHNPSDRPLPWGFGTHAYFRLPLSAQTESSQCTVKVPGRRIWELNDFLPTGMKREPAPAVRLHEGRSFGGLKVDDIYSDVISEGEIVTCRISDPAAGLALEQRCPTDFRELVVFTPPWSESICMEPYTCVTDAIHLEQQGVDAGLKVLAPHSEWTSWIDIEVVPL
jgi:aldose 1-epimerase